MLHIKEISTYFSPGVAQKKSFMLREYLQYKILECISNSPFGSKLIFLGGTAIRIVHESQRFSEDLDFDNLGVSFEEFTELGLHIKEHMEYEGYTVELRHVQKGAFHCYIKFPELLFDEGLSSMKSEKILIQIDTVPQKFHYTPENFLLKKFEVFTEIKVTPPELLLAQKFYALFHRNRLQGRDFYDIMVLASKGIIPNYEYLSQTIQVRTSKELKEYVLEECKKVDFQALVENLEIFLFQPEKSKQLFHFTTFIEQSSL